jgi:hypothetical protein
MLSQEKKYCGGDHLHQAKQKGLIMKNISLLILSVSMATGISQAYADTSIQDLNDRAQNSANVLDEYMNDVQGAIPNSLLSHAQCVVVIPSFIKGGFIFGAEAGSGLATCLHYHRWRQLWFSGGPRRNRPRSRFHECECGRTSQHG